MYEKWPNFDELLEIAKCSPEKLEIIREREVNNLIESAPKEMHRRLRGSFFTLVEFIVISVASIQIADIFIEGLGGKIGYFHGICDFLKNG